MPIEIVDRYIDDVLSGTRPANRLELNAVKRHQSDLERDDIYFEEQKAQRALDFFPFLKHSKGRWAGESFELQPWQAFVVASLTGWMRPDGTRRFRTAYIEVPRKNGKSTLAAGIGLYLFFADNEAGAEVYTAATKRDQARITHSEATRMVKASPGLRKRIRTYKDNLHVLETASKFEPLGQDADTMDGLNVHGAIVDELHAHKTRAVWDVLETATGSRSEPLILAITTAGFDKHSICREQHDYTEKLVDGVTQDDSFFGIVYTIDEDDDWRDERAWLKANPNLGVSVSIDDMETLASRADAIPSQLNSFLRLKLNVWTESETRWIKADTWQGIEGEFTEDDLRGRQCYAGLDLASTTDVAALALVFPPEREDEPYRVINRYWIPRENMQRRVETDRVPYDVWVRDGWMTATEGNVIDYRYIMHEIDRLAQIYDIREVGFDRWGAPNLVQQLQDLGGDDWVVSIGQGYSSMSPASKEFEKLVLSGQLQHRGDPVLAWMIANTVVESDPAGNIKPSKSKSTEKIDGVVATIMAADRALRNTSDGRSVYESRGILVL
jgi:phage terminase large subunit-like protein